MRMGRADGKGGWKLLAAAKTIVFGSPTYMGSVSWQFKKFADSSSKAWFTGQWKDKLGAKAFGVRVAAATARLA